MCFYEGLSVLNTSLKGGSFLPPPPPPHTFSDTQNLIPHKQNPTKRIFILICVTDLPYIHLGCPRSPMSNLRAFWRYIVLVSRGVIFAPLIPDRVNLRVFRLNLNNKCYFPQYMFKVSSTYSFVVVSNRIYNLLRWYPSVFVYHCRCTNPLDLVVTISRRTRLSLYPVAFAHIFIVLIYCCIKLSLYPFANLSIVLFFRCTQ